MRLIKSLCVQVLPSLIRKLACSGLNTAHHIWCHFRPEFSIKYHALIDLSHPLSRFECFLKKASRSTLGFLKKLPQLFHFGCLCSRKYILSTSLWYFSLFWDKSNLTRTSRYLGNFFLRIELLYEKSISSGQNVLSFHFLRSITSASKKLFSISRPKHPALPKTAHHILPGSHINLCQSSCPSSVSSTWAISRIGSLLYASSSLFVWSYFHPLRLFFTITQWYISKANKRLVPHHIHRKSRLFSFANLYISGSFSKSSIVFISK